MASDFWQTIILDSPDLAPPVIVAGPTVVHLSDTSVSINWQTNEPANSVVDYGASGLSLSVSSASMVTLHEVTLVDLSPATIYQYRVGSTDSTGNGPTQSAVLTFQTQAPPGDITPPVITSGPTATSIAQTTAIIVWTTDEPASTVVHYGTTADVGTLVSLGEFTGSHQVTLTDLTPSTQYFFQAESKDPDGNGPTLSEVLSFTTAAVPDTAAPQILTGPEATEITDKTMKVVWTTDEPATSGASYNDGTTYFVVSDTKLVKEHEMVLADLTPGTTYHITVSSTDLAGNGPTLAGPIDATTSTVSGHPPVVIVPDPITVEATGPAGAVVTFTATASDPEDGTLTPTCTPASGQTFALGGTTVVCQATDSAGATTSASFPVTVRDTTPPSLSLPDEVVAIADPDGGALVTYEATATDLVSGALVPSCTPASGSRFAMGETTVNCGAQDGAGNEATGSFPVRVQKVNTPPTIIVPPGVVAEATGPDGAVVTLVVTASDVEDGPLAPVCTPASGSVFPLGTTLVNCLVADSAGLTTTATFTVTVSDTTGPALSLPDDMTVTASCGLGTVVTFASEATDLVSGSVPVVCSPRSGSRFRLGTTTVTCTAQDTSGNKSSGTFTVTVVRANHPPVITVPDDITVKATSSSGTKVTFRTSARDVEDGRLTPVCIPASGSLFPIGTTEVACTVTDSAGATASASFDVLVTEKRGCGGRRCGGCGRPEDGRAGHDGDGCSAKP